MARINSYLDLVPAGYLLGYDHPLIQEAQKNLDPAKAKSTSTLLVEAAMMDVEATKGGSSSAAGSSRTGKKRKLKQSNASASQAERQEGGEAGSRDELLQKLERRISELREERRKRQSEVDKARAQQMREQRAAQEKMQKAADLAREKSWQQRTPQKEGAAADGDGVEVGRLVFEPKTASLPFGTDVNRRGQKARRLRTELRKQEMAGEKLREAEARGEGEDLRKSMGLQKALLRAQGQKVHDDIHKLRKVQKAMDMRKKKGRDKREEQKEEIKRKQEERQTRRKENLAKRAANKKKNKRRSGFEGKRDGYLNSEA
uniref:Ribosomal RNA-processing protein 14/surfeit locus protein 6 C-terminal domain-containing protein n=1 Tax=Alexandrium monilatum TaxID=311494 RepID=A0A7S4R050_9DINO